MIKFLITTAITYRGHHKYGGDNLILLRQMQYIDFIQHMKTMPIEQFYCECVHPGPHTFLNDSIDTNHLFYSNTHNPSIRNIGVEEIKGCRAALTHFDFGENDIIVKLTGRYMPNSMLFIDSIIQNKNSFDAFYHPFPPDHSGTGQMFTGAFGIRKKYWQHYLDNADLITLEREMINVEYDMLSYLTTNDGIRLRPLNKLDITVYPGGGGETWQI